MSGTESAPPDYDLVCPDPIARSILREWLAGSRLVWPGRFRWSVSVSDRSPLEPDARPILRQPGVAIQAGPPSGTVRVEWERAPAVGVIHSTLPAVELWLSPAARSDLRKAERSFLLVILVFLLRRLGWYHVHGATLVDPAGRGWLLAGDSGSGKSTTSALLASLGWGVSSDDIAFLVDRGSSVAARGFHSPIALRPGGQTLLGARSGLALPDRRKEGYWPEELGGYWIGEVVPRVIGFPRSGDRTRLVALPAGEVLSRLVTWSQWVLYEAMHAQENLDLLARVTAQSRGYDVTLGPDLFANPDLLMERTQ